MGRWHQPREHQFLRERRRQGPSRRRSHETRQLQRFRDAEEILVRRPHPPRRNSKTVNDTATGGCTTLYRPVGPKELDLIAQSGYSEFPPRLEGQPIFYPVLNEDYARQIARDWNATNPAIGRGFVTRFRVNS